MVKADIKSAFGLVPIAPSQYHLFVLNISGMFFVDRCLQMECSSSCWIFERFATSLEWILRNKFGVKFMSHYLDDFIFFGKTQSECKKYLESFESDDL